MLYLYEIKLTVFNFLSMIDIKYTQILYFLLKVTLFYNLCVYLFVRLHWAVVREL